jgi:hypothetical protein
MSRFTDEINELPEALLRSLGADSRFVFFAPAGQTFSLTELCMSRTFRVMPGRIFFH